MTAQFQVLVGAIGILKNEPVEMDVVGIVHDPDTQATEYITFDGQVIPAQDIEWFAATVLADAADEDEPSNSRITTSDEMYR